MTTVEEQFTIKIRDKEYSVSIKKIDSRKYIVKIGNKTYEVEVSRKGIEIPNIQSKRLTSLDSRSIPTSVAAAKVVGEGHLIRTSIPGRIMKVLVRPGDRVERQTVVALLESMKMQLEIRAGRRGVVKKVLVKPGDVVNVNDVIAVVEPES